VKAIRVRHESAPTPMGCRWCGTPKQDHVQLWVPGKSWHGWTEPTREQIEARMRARFAARAKREQHQINAAGRALAESAIKSKSITEKE